MTFILLNLSHCTNFNSESDEFFFSSGFQDIHKHNLLYGTFYYYDLFTHLTFKNILFLRADFTNGGKNLLDRSQIKKRG